MKTHNEKGLKLSIFTCLQAFHSGTNDYICTLAPDFLYSCSHERIYVFSERIPG